MDQNERDSMPSDDFEESLLRLTPVRRELLGRMHRTFLVCHRELSLAESLLRTFRVGAPESGGEPAEWLPGQSLFNHPDLEQWVSSLEKLEHLSEEGIRDPALRELAERVTAQSSAMILWTMHFMFDFGESLRALEGAIGAGKATPERPASPA